MITGFVTVSDNPILYFKEKITMNNKIYQGFAIAFLSGLAQLSIAENYSSELTGSYLSGDVDGQSANVEMYGVTQQVFLSEVDTDVGPLATAAFVSRASSYVLGYSEFGNEDADMGIVGIDWRDKESGTTFGLSYSFSDIDFNNFSAEQTVAKIGKYVGETTEVSLQYAREENKLTSILVKDAYILAISHVGVGDVGFAINGSITVSDVLKNDKNIINDAVSELIDLTYDEQFSFAVSATLYPTRKLGLGAGFDITLADIDDDKVFAFAEWFFKPDVKGKATYFISDQDNIDVNGLSLELSLRL